MARWTSLINGSISILAGFLLIWKSGSIRKIMLREEKLHYMERLKGSFLYYPIVVGTKIFIFWLAFLLLILGALSIRRFILSFP